MNRFKRHIAASALAAAVIGFGIIWHTQIVGAQRGGWGQRRSYDVEGLEYAQRTIFPDNKFIFCRIRYTSRGEGSNNRFYGKWYTDYPDSDENFSLRLSELTTLNVPRDEQGGFAHAVVDVGDEKIFDYPFTYMIEPGDLMFSEEEIINLRKYLLRGGFMMVDDFWGQAEWENFVLEISRVFDPDIYPLIELELDHPIFHMVFDLEEKPQVPTPWGWQQGVMSETYDQDVAHYWGLYDGDRLMVVICHNTDLGDGWEREAMNIGYFEEVSAKLAYPMGINIVVYAMTH